jgi:hypothetical protein
MVTALHTRSRQTGRQHTHFICQRTPGHCLPNTAAFFAHSRTLRARLGVMQKELGKGIHA